MKVSLAIIAKDEVEQIERIARDYSKYFHEIVVAWDDEEIPKIEGVRFVPYKWRDDFAHKRNFLTEHINTEYYFRIDTDDIILNPENLEKLFDKAEKNKADCIYLSYIYARDDDGNTVAEHWRESLIRKSDGIYWKKPIHENLFIEDLESYQSAKDKTVKILHEVDERHAEESAQRNFKILLKEYQEDGEYTDPRTLAYIGRMLMGFGQWHKAIPFLEMLVNKSGWEDDRYFAYTEIGFCHSRLGNNSKAISACLEAIVINPEYPDAYICLGEVYTEQKDYKKALEWLLQASSKKRPETMQVYDPSRYTVRLATDLAIAYFGVGEFEKAKVVYEKAKKMAPNNEWIKENKKLFEDGFEQDKYIKNFLWLLLYTKEKDAEKTKALVEAVPKNLLSDERIQKIRHDILPPKEWSDKSVVIFCGKGWEEWGDPSVISGLGGSEEAVVYLSRELVKLGYEVTVFNNCGDLEGKFNGVTYQPFYNFNPNDDYNIVISWRGNMFKSGRIKAVRKLIWMHDVPQQGQFKEDEIDTFDKVIVLSNYHKTLLPEHIPSEKVFVSSNGINLEDFKIGNDERNLNRLIYASSYDRGIQHLLQRWPKVKKAVPNAELHIFYGWDVYDRMAEQGFRSWDFKESMLKLMRQEGVYEHGRVGHKKLNKEFQKSSLFVYPCHFEEISCITAMKAQANGCVPVTTNYAALKETVKEGVIVEGNAREVADKFVDRLIECLKHNGQVEKLRDKVLLHRNEFGWNKVAKQWSEELFVRNLDGSSAKGLGVVTQ